MSRTRTLFVKARRAMQRGSIRSVYRCKIVQSTYRQARLWLAGPYRALFLRRVIFIGVTGSCGKTTAKDLITAVLSSQFNVCKSLGTINTQDRIAKTIFRVRPWDKFCVQEVAVTYLEKSLKLLRPHVGVVTNIGTDHISAFRTVEAIAAEKGKLIEALPPQHGIGILNADDANVLAMRSRCGGRIITYGLASDATLRAENVRCSWPERLSFRVLYDGQAYAVQTQLCGRHWVPCVLAALAVGLAMGVPLATAVRAVQTVPPVDRRMSPLSLDGITIIRDDWKAPFWSFSMTLEFMREANAKRKIVVIGTISDYTGNSNRKYISTARQALAVADHVIFVGPRASKCLKARRHPQDNALEAFYSIEVARDYLRCLSQPGDLVLIKSSDRDRLGEIMWARPVGEERLPARWVSEALPEESRPPQNKLPSVSPAASKHSPQVVVGLGNVGLKYQNTPHNVGQRALDSLARSLVVKWTQMDQAMVARVEWQGESVYLVKPLTGVNRSGAALSQLGDRLGFGAAECILVHDDVDLALGAVRRQMRGGDGGHRGVRSILETFGTDAMRRVKIGVGRPERQDLVRGHVVAAFSPAELPAIERACTEAADRALELVASGEGGLPVAGRGALSNMHTSMHEHRHVTTFARNNTRD